ncbi:MAG: TonB-dependent receptor, partial [Verrucomicrobiota bacterium]
MNTKKLRFVSIGLGLRRLAFALAMLGCLGFAATVAGAAEPVVRPFELPAGAAETTLRQFAAQAGDQFVFSSEKVAGVQTVAVKGQYTARQALERMLAGTDLRAVQDERTGALTVDRAPAVRGATTGTITGRVFNKTNGNYVGNARVAIEAQRLETFTDEFGYFTLGRVAAGEASVRASFTGLPAQTQSVRVAAGERADLLITLQAEGGGSDTTIVLDAFKVASQRDMAASDVAVNEQRFAADIKNVVSTDSFADIADGNVGEFAKYLPGVTLNRSGSDGLNMSLGGVPASGTPILLDGMGIASASSSNTERTVEFENISVGSMSRVEVSRSPAPDSPASAIGGSVNLVSRNSFERSKPFYSVRGYASFRGEDFSWSKEPGPFQHAEPMYRPNLELTAVVPVNRTFGFTFSALAA